MSRIFNQKNVWGSQGGVNAQRTDLWQIDFTQVIRGINSQIFEGSLDTDIQPLVSEVEPYYVASVSMPTVRIKAEEYRRDSKPYMMPGFDDPLSEINVVFIMESPILTAQSKVYTFLDVWRAFTRAGRGAMGNERTVTLNQRYRVDFKFPVSIKLYRGNAHPSAYLISQTLSTQGSEFKSDVRTLISKIPENQDTNKTAYDNRVAGIVAASDVAHNAVENDLEICGLFQVEGMWLSSFKVTDLDYSKGNEITRIEASFYADNIRDLNQQ